MMQLTRTGITVLNQLNGSQTVQEVQVENLTEGEKLNAPERLHVGLHSRDGTFSQLEIKLSTF